MSVSKPYAFLPDEVSFRSTAAAHDRLIYAPLCGIDGESIKSAITPFLSGDIKIDKSRYLTKPASREDLRMPVRNFFVRVEGKGVLAMAQRTQGDDSCVEVGQLWHKLTRTNSAFGLQLTALSFVPVSGEKIELTRFTVRNVSPEDVIFTPTAVIPVFARSLANKHDHEHVTALLNRVDQLPQGVFVEPTMRFNEEGHKTASEVYFVAGTEGDGALPAGTFPTFESFFGFDGDFDHPRAVMMNEVPRILSDAERQGQEVAGAIRFGDARLKPGEEKSFIIGIGIGTDRKACLHEFGRFNTSGLFDAALALNAEFWAGKTSSIKFNDGDPAYGSWMRWVTLQPILRRIFGCSFLPDHDYGKGGKGWRDIWQDLLSLILIEPETVRGDLLNNFAGVRIDGSNATIIGQKPGEFIADRNAITRVWMDHGVWPFLTTLLYVDQTGDDAFLFEDVSYFADPQMSRTFEHNMSWTSSYGHQLKDKKGQAYRGSVLEHILVQHLVQFYNVGEHNMTRLESADWNDGLDMAFKRGESVAFMAFYGGNLLSVARLLERLARDKNISTIKVAKELLLLLDTMSQPVNYDDAKAKQALLFKKYFYAVQPELSGETIEISVMKVVADLRKKGEWVLAHIREKEKVAVDVGGEKFTWFNGYYDNNGERLEGFKDGRVWMTLTGQVFALMHGVASADEARGIVKAVRRFLKDETLGGYRLNTDFGMRHHLALGRAFGFAFGTKENGAIFSHMCVMYAYALYIRGFSREGFEVMRSLYAMSTHPGRAQIYPGIPEYFDASGRGMYHFLTGSASWYVLTLLTQAYGVRGEAGDLVLAPQLVKEEFSPQGEARVSLQFAGRKISVVYLNPGKLDAGQYGIKSLEANGHSLEFSRKGKTSISIARKDIRSFPEPAELKVVLGV
jgi:cellobiose phosphorylase